MSMPFSRAPHIEGVGAALHSAHAPNAALLIDFDNVTMGMRSDLSKELKTLLKSDVIKGKVTIQRAYADWRRYPQYIVPLSEASVDLIFAPAYGSSKKNATDIRMAIDGIELVFTRPEIGVFILLTGDSDFSSLVLKLKEYGKYVIGVGIQESSSDILVQNCDEYYSYNAISGLRKSDESGAAPGDPWQLVERAVEQMAKRGDVMRSDRLKQVMLEMDPTFDEKGLGFKQFSRFLATASSKGLVQTQKMENGQFEIVPPSGARRTEDRPAPRRSDRGRGGRGRGEGRGDRGREERDAAPREGAPPSEPTVAGEPGSPVEATRDLRGAYTLLRTAVTALTGEQGSDAVRDSDVKRRMLVLDSTFDESVLGFPKFSRFLARAHDQDIVIVNKGDDGNYQVAMGNGSVEAAVAAGAAPEATPYVTTSTPYVAPPTEGSLASPIEAGFTPPSPSAPREEAPEVEPADAQPAKTEAPKVGGSLWSRLLRPREASRKGIEGSEPPPLLEGQGVPSRKPPGISTPTSAAVPRGPALDPASLHLPTGSVTLVQYLTTYPGVGEKTAETLVTALGDQLFVVLQTDPARVEALLPPTRAEKVIEGWVADLERRKAEYGGVPLAGTSSGPSTGGDLFGDESSSLFSPRGRRTRGEP